MKKVGLTGGLGTGKSTVANMLAAKGAAVFHADEFGHRALTIPNLAYFQTVAEFGTGILDRNTGGPPDWEIDREKLGRIVFPDPAKLKRLESFVHPAVHQMWRDAVAINELSKPNGVIVFEVAILFEHGLESNFDHIIATTCSREQQIERGMKRDLTTRERIEARLNRQISFDSCRDRCHSIIDTSDWSTVPGQVDQIWQALS